MTSVIVVGGGIVGTSVAYHLTKNRYDVTIVDEHAPVGIGSSRTFACTNYFSFVEEPYFSFRRDAISFSQTLARDVGASKHVHVSGTLRWGDSGPGREAVQAFASRLQQKGVAVEYWTPYDVQQRLEPELRLEEVEGPIIRLEDEGWIDSIPFIGQLRQAASETGRVKVLTAKVLHIESREGDVCVATDAGDLRGAFVCLAAGSGTSTLTKELGYEIEVTQDPGLLFTASVPRSILKHIIYAADLHLRPECDARVMGGQTAPFDGSDEVARRESLRLTAELTKILPVLSHAQDVQAFAVSRPIPSDGLPIAGWLPEIDRVYVAACHSGMTVGPLLGMLCANEILGKASALPAEFRSSRFNPAMSRTRAQG